MKQIIKLTIVLSLFAQVCHAQKVETEEAYKAYNDSIISLLKIAKKDADNYVGKPFSDLIKHFEKCGVKITLARIDNYDHERVFPQHIYGLTVMFISNEIYDLMRKYDLYTPEVYIDFEGSKPYEKALSLFKEKEDDGYKQSVRFQGNFTKEVEAFYSDAVIKSIKFGFMDGRIYSHPITNPKAWKYLPSSNCKEKSLPER